MVSLPWTMIELMSAGTEEYDDNVTVRGCVEERMRWESRQNNSSALGESLPKACRG